MTRKIIHERAAGALWPAIIGAMFSLGLVLPVVQAMGLGDVSAAVWAIALASVACAVAGLGGHFRWIGAGAGVLLVGIAAAATGTLSNLGGMLGAAVHLVRGNVEPLRVYGPEVALVAGALLALAGWAMARQSAGFYPALSLTLVVVLIVWFSGNRDVLAWFTPALIALCAMFAHSVNQETPMVRVVGMSALVVLVALGLFPALQFRSNTFEDLAERLRTYITDTFFFTDPRSIYTIQSDGYKPLQNRLGGPVNIEERPVMTVRTSRSLLLRGTVYNEYNGLNWIDTLSSRRYLYSDLRNRALRADALDEQRPAQSLRESPLFETIPVTVTMNADSASTMFVHQRASNLTTPMALVPYFNMSGEIFITRDLEAGDSYTFDAPIIRADDERLPGLLAAAALSGEDTKELSYYLRLPEAIADQVYQLTEEITRTAGNPLENALAIRDYLKAAFRYTTSPATPPDNQDFVSYFLLRGREGYCTYFASAMAVMGRIAGLPTRYVEGYIVDPSGGTALITSKQAHAWCEVYFDGFGWVAFDATPPESMGGPRRDDSAPDEEAPDEAPPTEEPDTDGEDDNEEEQPEGGGGGEQQPDPDEGEPSPEETPTPEPDPQPEDTPTPAPDDTPEQTPEDEPQPEDYEDYGDDDKPRSLWWLWLLALAVVGLLTWRGIWTRPEAAAGRQPDDAARLLTWYQALLGLLAASGMPARPHETPVAYAARVEQGIPPEAGLLGVAEAVSHLGYGSAGDIGPAEVQAAAKCYGAVWRAVPIKGRLRWLVRRMVRGIGSARQVP